MIDYLINAFKEVFNKPGYIILSILTALLILFVNVVLLNFRLLIDYFNFALLWHLFYGGLVIMPYFVAFTLVIISVLSGILVSLAIYQIRRQIALNSSVGFIGVVFGIVAPACPACAIGLLPLLGLGGLFAFLPFGGKEVSIFTIGLLLVAIGYVSKKINTNTCSVN
tara:strand:- start:434 stop:934 length:501 start_codon:yes stop_codon:yes gene_type:complete